MVRYDNDFETIRKIEFKPRIKPNHNANAFFKWRAITTKRGNWLSVFFFRLLSCWLSVESGAIWSFAGPAIFVISVGVLN